MYHRDHIEHLLQELDFLKVLVSRFGERPKVTGLEADIALLKVQDIYEQLLRMKLMPEADAVAEKKSKPERPAERVSAPVEDKAPVKDSADAEIAPPAPLNGHRSVSEPRPEAPVAPAKKEEKAGRATKEEAVKKDEPVPAPKEKAPAEKPAESAPPKKTGILAEKIRPDAPQPINETLARQKPGSDVAGKWQTVPLDAIASGIGLNDKFLYIRELFRGDSVLYHETIVRLDAAASLNEALDHISQNFDWNPDADTAQKFIHLIRRRHGGKN